MLYKYMWTGTYMYFIRMEHVCMRTEFIRICVRIKICIATEGIYIYVHICIYIYLYIHAYVCTRIHIYIYIHTHTHTTRGGGLGSRPQKMYGERLGDGVEYHLMSPTPRR